jgi:hypothetical protein
MFVLPYSILRGNGCDLETLYAGQMSRALRALPRCRFSTAFGLCCCVLCARRLHAAPARVRLLQLRKRGCGMRCPLHDRKKRLLLQLAISSSDNTFSRENLLHSPLCSCRSSDN